MSLPRLTVAFGVLVFCSSGPTASMELILPLSTFRLESNVLGAGSVVTVSGTQTEKGLSLLIVEAFGRRCELKEQALGPLKGVDVNGIDLTYQGGRPETGGRVVGLVLRRGIVEYRVTLPEHGSARVDGPTRR